MSSRKNSLVIFNIDVKTKVKLLKVHCGFKHFGCECFRKQKQSHPIEVLRESSAAAAAATTATHDQPETEHTSLNISVLKKEEHQKFQPLD